MSDYIVNILPLCPNQEKGTLFKECLAGMSAASSVDTWYGHKRMFDVIMDGQRIILSGGKLHLKNYEISIINEDYPHNRSLLDDWIKKFNLLVLYCDARTLSNYRDRVAIIRNTMHSRNRSSDVFLFLTHIGEVMNITGMPTEQQTLIGIYSALSPEPSSTTKLKDSYSGCSLDSSYWLDQQFSRYHDNTRHCFFQMPRGLICDCGQSSGYCDLLLTIIKCSLSQKHIVLNKSIGHPILINRNNHQSPNNNNMNIVQSISKKKQDKKTIRLAVVGDTSSGKTFFLQDFCQALSALQFEYIDNSQFPFSSHSDFKGDIHDVGYGNTPNYACQQCNHYVGDYIKDGKDVRIEFLDIPGEIFELEDGEPRRMDTCGRIIRWLNGLRGSREKWFTVTNWNCGESVKKIVTFNKKGSEGENTDSTKEKNNNTAPIDTNLTRARRLKSYDEFSVYLDYLKQCGYEKDDNNTYQINGRELLNDFFSYDAHSVFETMKNIFDRVGDRLNRISENQYREYVKSLYFFVFLYHATDIVLCQMCLSTQDGNGNPQGNNVDTIVSIMGQLKDFYRNVKMGRKKYYLAIKGSDNFLRPDNSKNLYRNCGKDLNIFYSIFTSQINQFLYGPEIHDTNHVFSGDGQFVSKSERQFHMENLRLEEIVDGDKIPNETISDCIYAFRTSLLGMNNPDLNLISPHIYFCATPIDYEFEIDVFCDADNNNRHAVKGKTIDGRSLRPEFRVCFGTVQLVMDILENMRNRNFFLYEGGGYSKPGKIINYLQGK